jgi:hypothetical protein
MPVTFHDHDSPTNNDLNISFFSKLNSLSYNFKYISNIADDL